MPNPLLNTHAAHEDMQQKAARAIQQNLSVAGKLRKIEVDSVEFVGNKQPTDYAGQRDVKDKGGTWGQSVRANISLRDLKTNKVLSRQKVTVGVLPAVTSRFSYIVGGREYQVTNQFRRMSGVYTRIADNGELQAVAANERLGQLKMKFDPNTRTITILPIRGKQSELNMYVLLRAAGRTDAEIEKKWGKGIVATNRAIYEKTTSKARLIAIAKQIDPMVNPTSAPHAAQIIMRKLKEFTFDERITKDILGQPHVMLNESALLDAGAQLTGISRGEIKPSSYDNVGHKKFLNAGDLLEDYINRQGGQIQRRVKNKVDREVDIDKIVRANTVGREINRFFRQGAETRLSSEAKQTNPISFFTGQLATTVKGMGGISSGPGQSTGQAQTVQSSHIGFLDPVDTGEKLESGLDLAMALGAVKNGQRIYARMFSMKTKTIEEVDPLVADRSYVAFPEDIEIVGNKVKALKARVKCMNPEGKFEDVPLSRVDYILLSGQHQFGVATNLVPFLGNNNGNRTMMGAKQMLQSVQLKHREAPLVQAATSEKKTTTFESVLGRSQAVLSSDDGVVQSITKDAIKVKHGKSVKTYGLYDRFQTNDTRAFLQHTPVVEKGQRVTKGQLLADLNYTKDGVLATGTNLRFAYVPMKGYNFEDGVVISESAAEKLTSEHLHREERDSTNQLGTEPTPKEMNDMPIGSVVVSKKKFMAWAGASARMNPASLEKLDDSGVIKQGSVVEKGDVLIACVRKRQTDDTLRALKKATRFNSPWGAAEVRWTKDTKGKIARVVKTGKNVVVYIHTEERMGIGDKIAGRYGNKGIITKVLPDHEMPFYTDKNGEKQHVEVAMHPAAVPGRINPGQLLEMGASKIAEKTGKPYIVSGFDRQSKDRTRELLAEMKKHGISDEETLIDPATGKTMGSVITGKQYAIKLEHMADKKMTARAGGPNIPGLESYSYDLNNQPAQGYPSGGQAQGGLGMYALLGHNARANIRELQTHKSTYEQPKKWGDYDSDEYWHALMSGTPLPAPQPTFAVKKFESYLKGMGINPKRKADELLLVPMTDADVLKDCTFEVKQPNKFIDGKKGEPEKGGLFDFPEGQVSSTRWGHIKLKRRLINPVFESPVAILVGAKEADLNDIIAGRKKLPNGKTGMDGILETLHAINVEEAIRTTEASMKGLVKQDKDRAYKKLKVLAALKKLNMSPERAYTMGVMPVLPPHMRPISLSSEVGALGDVETVDVNHMYRLVGMSNMLYGQLPKEATSKMKNELALELYDNVRKTYVEGALNNRGAPISSLLQTVTNPKAQKGLRQGKEGFFQRKLIMRRSDLSGRSVITVEPDLGLDEVGIPRKMALQIYRPFIVRELKSNGYSGREAIEKLRTDPTADVVTSALERVVKSRPVLMKRDPALHRFSVMAFYPRIVSGKAIKIHPMVVGGFNADFDGDTMAAFVPSSDEAVEEAKRMVPSKNLIGTKDFSLMNTPSWDFIYGIWQLTELRAEKKKSYVTPSALLEAHKKGEVDTNDTIRIKGKKSCAGRAMLWSKMTPEAQAVYGDELLYGPDLNAKKAKDMLQRIAKSHTGVFPRIVDGWKELGARNAYEDAWSYGLKDHKTYASIRDKHLAAADKKLAGMRATDADRVRVYSEATRKINKETVAAMKKDKNRLYRMTGQSGAMASKTNQVLQMVSSPLQVVDMEGRVVPEPIRRSYAEGFHSSGYWTTIPGVRAGTLSRARGTAEPGAMGKSVINLAIGLTVTGKDCNTRTGVDISTANIDIESRYLPSELKVGGKSYPRNTLITPEIAMEIRKHHKVIQVRSTLTCAFTSGICAYCSGDSPNGKLYQSGENVGVLSAQSLSEPTSQMTMNAFHTGGSAQDKSAKSVDEFERMSQLFDLPQTLKDQATITTTTGRVKKIEKDKEAGGYFVTVDNQTFRVPTGHDLKVKLGDKVLAGDPLCDGPINPHELLEAAGLDATRKYLVDETSAVFDRFGTRRRHIECIVRQMTNVVEVISDPEHRFVPGDYAARTQIKKINEERAKEGRPPVKTKPKLKRIEDAVTINNEEDFLAGLNYRNLRKVLVNAATYGGKSDLHGTNPLPGMAYGAEFGKGKREGTY